MADRGSSVDRYTRHRRITPLAPLLDKEFRWHKHTVGRRWRMDEAFKKSKINGGICIVQSMLQVLTSDFC